MGRVRIAALLTAWTLLSAFTWAANSPNKVPFKLYRGYLIVVRGSIGGLKNLNFLVDTGAVPSVIDARIAHKLHLRGQPGRVDVPTRTLTTERVIVSDVELGPSHVGELSVIVQDLSFAEEALGTRVDALIGFDVLGQSPFTIDYGSRNLVFGPVDPSFNTVPYFPGLPYAIVALQIQQQKLEILVDTGTSQSRLIPEWSAQLPSSHQHCWPGDVDQHGRRNASHEDTTARCIPWRGGLGTSRRLHSRKQHSSVFRTRRVAGDSGAREACCFRPSPRSGGVGEEMTIFGIKSSTKKG